MLFSHRIGAVVAAAALFSVALDASRALHAQQPAATRTAATTPPGAARALSLDEALRIAERESETVQIARAGIERARGTQLQARSQYLPQLNGSLQYTRTLKSQFSALQTSSPAPGPNVPPVPQRDTTTYFQPCTRYLANAGATEAQRLAGLEAFSRCSSGGGIDFSRVGFGSKNQYQLGLSGSLNLFAGGRITAQNDAAKAGRRTADIELSAQRAQLRLDVAQAYYDAALADRLVSIADSSLVQTEAALRQTSLARQVGNQSEFELLRARVTRDNQIPAVLQAKTTRELTYLRLKQLLNLPYADSLTLTDGIGDVESIGQVQTAANTNSAATAAAMVVALTDSLVSRSDTSADARATVRQLTEAVTTQEAQRRVAKAEYLPSLTLSSAYGRVAFPNAGIPDWNSFVNNWTVTVAASMPIFTGGRIRGENVVAAANVTEARARLQQTREFAALDARQAVAQLETAAATLAASSGTTEQATRAYNIAEVRFREGLSTQLELSESRVLLQQARANRAQAARDFQVARLRLTLLKDLPLGSSGTTGNAAGSAGGATAPGAGGAGARQQQQQPTQPRAGQSAASVSVPGQ
ncbi:MAG TPA: TolC family protein [Gemmatimonadaceae bacterium]|nr:TolC family protein [Gemmatimonadaceae bacterium]